MKMSGEAEVSWVQRTISGLLATRQLLVQTSSKKLPRVWRSFNQATPLRLPNSDHTGALRTLYKCKAAQHSNKRFSILYSLELLF